MSTGQTPMRKKKLEICKYKRCKIKTRKARKVEYQNEVYVGVFLASFHKRGRSRVINTGCKMPGMLTATSTLSRMDLKMA